jgi:hypothetical protein
MNDFEERIRRELTAVAAPARPETIRPLRAPVPRRRPRASRWLAPVAAVVAIACIAGVTVTGHLTASGPASAVGQPNIYVTLTAQYLQAPSKPSSPTLVGNKIVLFATVRDASTGAALTSVQVWPQQREHPRGEAVGYPGVAAQIAAAADDRTFAIGYGDSLYLLRVAASGRAARLVKLSETSVATGSSSIALSPDGTQLAADVESCPGNQACAEGVEIINLVTGATRTWLGSSMAGSPLNPSWTDNGKAVMFEWANSQWSKNGYRILSDTAPQGSLIAESAWLPYPAAGRSFPPQAILTPDGRSLLVETEKIVPTSSDSGTIIFRITDEDPATGRLLQVLRVYVQHYKGNPYVVGDQCDIIALASTGLHALLECPQFGRLDGSTFTPLRSGSPGLPSAPSINAAW